MIYPDIVEKSINQIAKTILGHVQIIYPSGKKCEESVQITHDWKDDKEKLSLPNGAPTVKMRQYLSSDLLFSTLIIAPKHFISLYFLVFLLVAFCYPESAVLFNYLLPEKTIMLIFEQFLRHRMNIFP